MSSHDEFYQHGLRRLVARDPEESHRVSSPLELFYDLTVVAAFGVAGSELAHAVVHGHAVQGVIAFALAMFAIIWAWTHYSWFASAFDNDDWLFRVLTLVQMAGVIILAIGLGPMFAGLTEGGGLNVAVMVAGYVVMRLALVGKWLRAGAHDPRYADLARASAVAIVIQQVFWVLVPVVAAHAALPVVAALLVVLIVLELSGPPFAQKYSVRRTGRDIPWHPHHIAERYSLLGIITVGETVIGTLAAAQQITAGHGWDFNGVAVIAVGVVMSFALWWAFFLLPSAPVLGRRREIAVRWSYLHMLVFAAIAAVGAGLHTIGYAFDAEAHASTLLITSAVAVPVLLFKVGLTLVQRTLVGAVPASVIHLVPYLAPLAGIGLAAAHLPLWLCLLVVLASPVTIVISYEAGDWRTLSAHLRGALERL